MNYQIVNLKNINDGRPQLSLPEINQEFAILCKMLQYIIRFNQSVFGSYLQYTASNILHQCNTYFKKLASTFRGALCIIFSGRCKFSSQILQDVIMLYWYCLLSCFDKIKAVLKDSFNDLKKKFIRVSNKVEV